MKTILFYLAMVLVTSAERDLACPTSSDRFYDPQTELCCKFGVTSNVNKDGQTLDCCNNTTYITETQVCCGKMYPKIGSDGKETKCCGVYPYIPTDNKKICCNGILHETERAGKRDNHQKCCGKEIISSSQVCCKKNKKARSYVKKSNMKCCYTDYYDKKTHYCNKGKVLPKHTKQCGFVRYDTRKQKCCNSKLFNISENDDHYKCCGSKLYNDIDQKCCEGDILIPHTAQCCKNNYYYNETQRCCKGSPTDFSKNTEQCCGLGLYDTQYQGCCGEKPYNTSTHECCYPNGDIIVKGTDYKCCGQYGYNSIHQVCCTDTNSQYEHFEAINKTPGHSFHDQCCAERDFKNQQSYSSRTHQCTLNGTVIPLQNMCGDMPYNDTTDLCCYGEMVKNGRIKGKECCGVQSYDKATQICCDDMIYLKTEKPSCNENTRSFRHMTKSSPLENRKSKSQDSFNEYNYGICHYCVNNTDDKKFRFLRKYPENVCKQKAVKIKVLNETSHGNQVTVKGMIRKDLFSQEIFKRKSIYFQLPCSCKLQAKNVILITDLDNYSRPLRLGDSDILIIWSRRINNSLQRRRHKCIDENNKLALETVLKIKTYVDFTNRQLKETLKH